MTIQRNKKNTAFAYFVVGIGALFYFYEYFLRIAPSIMKPQLMHAFSINATMFGTLSAFYFYAYTPMQLVVGILVDKFSIRKILMCAVTCCVIGSFLIATTHSYYVAGLGRFLQGFGSAFGFIAALKLASMWLAPERFAFFAGACATLGFLGAAFGQISLTSIVATIGWRWSIQLFTISGIMICVLIWLYIGRKPAHNMLNRVKHHKSLTFKEEFSQLLIIIKKPGIWVAGLLSCLMFLPTSVFAALWGVPYLKMLHHYSTQHAAIATAMIFIGWAIGAPLQGLISDYFGNRITIITLGAFIAYGIAMLVLYDPNLSYVELCTFFVLFGLTSSVQVLTFAMARDLTTHNLVGTTMAFINALAMLGGMIFQRGVGQILDFCAGKNSIVNGVHIYKLSDYKHAIFVIPLCLMIAGIIALLARDTIGKKEAEEWLD